MDHAGDKQHWNQHCQPSANSSLGLPEKVAEWTDGSELLVSGQHFHSIGFLCEGNLQISPALISWQKVLVIFWEHISGRGSWSLLYQFRPCATLQLHVPGLVLKEGDCCHPAPGTGHRDGQSRGSHRHCCLCLEDLEINPAKMAGRWVVLHRRKERSVFIKPGFNPSN